MKLLLVNLSEIFSSPISNFRRKKKGEDGGSSSEGIW